MPTKVKVTKGRSLPRRRQTEFGTLPLQSQELMTMPKKHIKPLKNGPRGLTDDEGINGEPVEVYNWRADTKRERHNALAELLLRSPPTVPAPKKMVKTVVEVSSTRGSSFFPGSDGNSRSSNLSRPRRHLKPKPSFYASQEATQPYKRPNAQGKFTGLLLVFFSNDTANTPHPKPTDPISPVSAKDIWGGEEFAKIMEKFDQGLADNELHLPPLLRNLEPMTQVNPNIADTCPLDVDLSVKATIDEVVPESDPVMRLSSSTGVAETILPPIFPPISAAKTQTLEDGNDPIEDDDVFVTRDVPLYLKKATKFPRSDGRSEMSEGNLQLQGGFTPRRSEGVRDNDVGEVESTKVNVSFKEEGGSFEEKKSLKRALRGRLAVGNSDKGSGGGNSGENAKNHSEVPNSDGHQDGNQSGVQNSDDNPNIQNSDHTQNSDDNDSNKNQSDAQISDSHSDAQDSNEKLTEYSEDHFESPKGRIAQIQRQTFEANSVRTRSSMPEQPKTPSRKRIEYREQAITRLSQDPFMASSPIKRPREVNLLEDDSPRALKKLFASATQTRALQIKKLRRRPLAEIRNAIQSSSVVNSPKAPSPLAKEKPQQVQQDISSPEVFSEGAESVHIPDAISEASARKAAGGDHTIPENPRDVKAAIMDSPSDRLQRRANTVQMPHLENRARNVLLDALPLPKIVTDKTWERLGGFGGEVSREKILIEDPIQKEKAHSSHDGGSKPTGQGPTQTQLTSILQGALNRGLVRLQSAATSTTTIVDTYRSHTGGFIERMSNRHNSEHNQLISEYEAHRKNVHTQCRAGIQRLQEFEARRHRLAAECKNELATLMAFEKNLGKS